MPMERGDAKHSHVLTIAVTSEQLPHIEIKLKPENNCNAYTVLMVRNKLPLYCPEFPH